MLVGAGHGNGPFLQWLKQAGAEGVTLVEAEDTHFARLQRLAESQPGWRARNDVVAPAPGPVSFHTASMATESGLLEPERLRALWPNITTRQTQSRDAISLRELLEEAAIPINWLVIDCMPAGALLQAAGEPLASVDVIFARGLLGNAGAMEQEGSLDATVHALTASGFRLVFTEAGRHPELGHALLVRDHTVELQTLRKQVTDAVASQREVQEQLRKAQATSDQLKQNLGDAQTARAQEAVLDEARVTELSAARSAAESLAAARQQELEQLKIRLVQAESARAQLTQTQTEGARLGARIAELEAAKNILDEKHAKSTAELVAAKAAVENLAATQQKELELVKHELASIEAASADQLNKAAADAAAALTSSKDAANRIKQLEDAKRAADRLAAERLAQIQALELRLQQMRAPSNGADGRLKQLEIEQAKAETQIALIKELIFQEAKA